MLTYCLNRLSLARISDDVTHVYFRINENVSFLPFDHKIFNFMTYCRGFVAVINELYIWLSLQMTCFIQSFHPAGFHVDCCLLISINSSLE